MSREYFYTPPHHIGTHELTIDGEEFAHLTHVMRKRPGDSVRVVNGAGTAYDVTILETSRHFARCRIEATSFHLNEPETDLTLGVALLKNGSRFDFLVEKATELGVQTIVPLLTERTIPQHARTERWKKLALAAMKQSCRCTLPVIKDLMEYQRFIGESPRHGKNLVPHESTKGPHLADLVRQPPLSPVSLAIGPEGGLTEEEVNAAISAGFIPVSLGPRRLRTETAAVVASGLIFS